MDAHYHKVMSAIDAITDSGTRYYFAYSGVLDRAAFEEWRTQHSYEFFDLPKGQLAELKDMDLIFDFPSRWWGGLVAGIAEKKDANIFGILYEIPKKHWPVVQHKEGVISGMCIEKEVKVISNGKEFLATAFTTAPHKANTNGEISKDYIDALIRGARQSGLPENYIAKLNNYL